MILVFIIYLNVTLIKTTEDAAQKIINHYVVRNSFQEEDFIVMTTYVKLLKK